MKKIIIKFFTIVFALAALLVACKKEPVQGVKIEAKLLVSVGKTETLTPSIIPPTAHNKNVSWESADPTIATVENGKVTGKAFGKTTITVITEDGGKTAKCMVTVIQPVEPVDMIWVEGGTFMMGCSDDECNEWELPMHEVTLSGFYISKYVVTLKEWIATMADSRSEFQGDNVPANLMRWSEVQEYISRLNAYTGKNYRLPTEAEWEYAARGGKKSEGYKYSGSNNISEVAWYKGSILHPVGQKKPNELGLYDMSGNIFEWCSDYYSDYTSESKINPTGPQTGSRRIVRGGAYYLDASFSRIPYRMSLPPDDIIFVGFRLVLPQ